MAEAEIKGSTTIIELLKRYPDGRAARLMAELNWACAHCGGAFHEPLTMAAKRHARDPRAVLDAFRALDGSGPTREQVEAARRMVECAGPERLRGALGAAVALGARGGA